MYGAKRVVQSTQLRLARAHLLQPLPLCDHIHPQGVKGGDHLPHGQVHRLFIEHHAVALSFLEARGLVILRRN